MLGLLREDKGAAAQVLMNLGLRLEKVRAEIQAILGRSSEHEESHAYVPEPTTEKGKVDVGSWLLTVATWDSLLPLCVLTVPYLIGILVPNNRGAIEVAATVMPITAFFIRFVVGRRHIASNQCGVIVRRVQLCFLGLGIVVLVLIDAVLILSHVMPKGAAWNNPTDRMVWAVLGSVYLISMTVAMYPGRTTAIRSPYPSD